jgi:mannose-6-phosphate isomerase-like protein (cupin superfamily)
MMKFCALLAACVGLPLLCSTAVCQTPAVAYSRQELVQLADQMHEQMKNSPNVGTGLFEKRLDSSTILAFRNKDGSAEAHQQFGDVFVVLRGSATLVTGGTITSPVTTAPGEIRGAAIQQGARRDLKEGDIAHIPAATPHQLLVPPGGSFTYFVVKVPLK